MAKKSPVRPRGNAKRGALGGVSSGAAAAGVVGALATLWWFSGGGGTAKLPAEPPKVCANLDASCPTWSAQGECTINQVYMHKHCPLSCGKCVDTRKQPSTATAGRKDRRYMCERDPAEHPTLIPGTLGSVFRDAVAKYPQYDPKVLSTDPWVVTFDNLFTKEEATRLFDLGAKSLARSASVAGLDENGQFKKSVSDVRTSENSWCMDRDCGSDPLVSKLTQRIAQITQSSPKAFELYQVLRYKPGEYYRSHHDWVDAHTEFPFGPRVFTFFLYLSDVEEGGGTHFPQLNITVQPKLGRALWWPSVLESAPDTQDHRTMHEAQPVAHGTKMAANVWIHLYDFMTPYTKGCAP